MYCLPLGEVSHLEQEKQKTTGIKNSSQKRRCISQADESINAKRQNCQGGVIFVYNLMHTSLNFISYILEFTSKRPLKKEKKKKKEI